ncbi:MAG: PACE efflux transporter [Burkholderiales bacterium]
MNSARCSTKPRPAIRDLRERVIQTLWFELLGLALVAPLFAYFSGVSAGDSFALLLALAIVVTFWSGLYNSAFDLAELHLAGRVASERPHRWRVLHTVGLETSAIVLTWPLVVAFTTLGWREALLADIGLTLAYIAYGYVFHIAFDRLRPVQGEPRSLR